MHEGEGEVGRGAEVGADEGVRLASGLFPMIDPCDPGALDTLRAAVAAGQRVRLLPVPVGADAEARANAAAFAQGARRVLAEATGTAMPISVTVPVASGNRAQRRARRRR